MLKWFEKLVDPYPSKGLTEPLPTRFFPFVWQAATGVRPYLLLLVLCTAGAASFEAVLYAKIGEAYSFNTGKKMLKFSEEEIVQSIFSNKYKL